MKEILKAMNLLDQHGFYKLADKLENEMVRLSAFPYNLSSLDELPYSARNVPWSKNKEDYEQYDNIFWKELKQRIPDYKSLNTDPDEAHNMEGEMHGDDPVPGPAFVWPEAGNTSPSMAGGLDNYTWEEAHDKNEGPDYWKNLQPRR